MEALLRDRIDVYKLHKRQSNVIRKENGISNDSFKFYGEGSFTNQQKNVILQKRKNSSNQPQKGNISVTKYNIYRKAQVIDIILKQVRQHSRENSSGTHNKAQIDSQYNGIISDSFQIKKKLQSIQKEIETRISQNQKNKKKKGDDLFQSKTPNSNHNNFNLQLLPHTTKANYEKQNNDSLKMKFFHPQEDSIVSQQITVKTLEKESTNSQEQRREIETALKINENSEIVLDNYEQRKVLNFQFTKAFDTNNFQFPSYLYGYTYDPQKRKSPQKQQQKFKFPLKKNSMRYAQESNISSQLQTEVEDKDVIQHEKKSLSKNFEQWKQDNYMLKQIQMNGQNEVFLLIVIQFLKNILYKKIYEQYLNVESQNRKCIGKQRKLIKLNDPLIDESLMQSSFSGKQIHKIQIASDLAAKVPFLWQEQSEEGTTMSGSGSADYMTCKSSDQKDKTAKFKEEFMVGKQIGSGSYASVRHCVHRKELKTYALKIYSKCSLTASRKRSILREIRLLQYIHHQNIIRIYDALETNNHVNLLLELVQGNSLAKIFKSKPFTLNEVKNIVFQIATALVYLHQRHITHRDIKLENILYIESTQTIKLIDFGFSTLFHRDVKKKMFCGTPSYMAPEIVQKSVYRGQGVDIWALGILCFALLTQTFPFKGGSDKELYTKITSGEFNIQKVNDSQACDLISRMICVEPDRRIDAESILNHDWFKQNLPNIINEKFKLCKTLFSKKTKDSSKNQEKNIKSIRYHHIEQRLPTFQRLFFDPAVKSCLNSPRNCEKNTETIKKNMEDNLCQNTTNLNLYQLQQELKILEGQRELSLESYKKFVHQNNNMIKQDPKKKENPNQNNYFKKPPHNQTIHPSFIPSFMSSVTSAKSPSYDSNHYLSKGKHKQFMYFIHRKVWQIIKLKQWELNIQ